MGHPSLEDDGEDGSDRQPRHQVEGEPLPVFEDRVHVSWKW